MPSMSNADLTPLFARNVKCLVYRPRKGRYHLVCGRDVKYTLCRRVDVQESRTNYIDAAVIDCRYCSNYLTGKVRQMVDEAFGLCLTIDNASVAYDFYDGKRAAQRLIAIWVYRNMNS